MSIIACQFCYFLTLLVDCSSWYVCWRLPKQMESLTLLPHHRCAERSIAKLTFSIWCYVKQATNLVWSMESDGSWNIMRWSLLIDRPTWFGISHQPPPSPFFVSVALKQAFSPPIPHIPPSIFTVYGLQSAPIKFAIPYSSSKILSSVILRKSLACLLLCSSPAIRIKDIKICSIQIYTNLSKYNQRYSKIFKYMLSSQILWRSLACLLLFSPRPQQCSQ